ncbi:MAG TPA: hypothetical protein DD409_02055 [Bacteroidales bacterium]|nr:hypothetical protein [Bacteroidales bacterium]
MFMVNVLTRKARNNLGWGLSWVSKVTIFLEYRSTDFLKNTPNGIKYTLSADSATFFIYLPSLSFHTDH